MGKSIYQIVNEKIVEQLRKGVIPWRMPWKQAGVPSNFISKKAYRGINVFLLACQGYTSPYWLSFKQCQAKGGQVRKGEKATLVIYWKILEKKEAGRAGDGATVVKKIPLLRYYQVFNVEQCEGLTVPAVDEGKLEFEPIGLAEAVADGYLDKPELQSKENQAYYAPSLDIVNMPKKENFKSVSGYYASLFHELVHSTGHVDRLAREGVAQSAGFGSERYSKEELVAEFGASFLCGLCGIESELENSASYISGWMQKIAENEKWLVTSATQAQKAVEYMLGTYYGQPAEAVPAVEAEPVEAVAEFSTGLDCNVGGQFEFEAGIECVNCGGASRRVRVRADYGRGYRWLAQCYSCLQYQELDNGEFSTGIKSLTVGELVQIKKSHKLGEVLEVSEDGKACKVHVRTGEKVPDRFYKEYELKKGGVA